MSRKFSLASVALALAALAVGYGDATAGATEQHRRANDASRATVVASNGLRVVAHPTRIVSLSASATEDLYAVGAGRQVVAVDEYSTNPRSAPRTKLSGYQPNVEAIAAYKPDLVIDDQDADHLTAHLRALGIPVLIESAPSSLSGAYGQIQLLGEATGHTSQAAGVVRRMRRQIALTIASVRHLSKRLTVYHELDQTLYSASSHTFIGQLYSLLGLRNISDPAVKLSDYPQLSSEYVIAADPDLIVLADTVCCGQSARTVATRPGWSVISAVREHHILAVNDSVASQWGPPIVQFFRVVAGEVRRIESHS